MIKKILLSTLLLPLLLSIACQLDNGSVSGEQENTFLENLEDMGVDTDLGERKDSNGNSLSTDYNPIGTKVGVLFKQAEIFTAGAGFSESGTQDNPVLLGDKTENFSELYVNTSLTQDFEIPQKSLAADVDGDGLDEVITVVNYLENNNFILLLTDYGNGTPSTTEIWNSEEQSDDCFGITLEHTLKGTALGSDDWEDSYFRQDMASGDLDGDGKQEIVLVIGFTLFVFNSVDNGCLLQGNSTFENLDTDSDSYVRVDCGDFDMDGLDEMIFTNGEISGLTIAKYYIMDDLSSNSSSQTSSFLDEGSIMVNADGQTYSLMAADVVVGDFDNDGLPEAAMCGQGNHASASEDLYYLVLDTSMNSESQPEFGFLESVRTDEGNDLLFQGLAAGDMNGDGSDEIVCFDDIFIVENGELDYFIDQNESMTNQPFMDLVVMEDVDGDKKADIVYMYVNVMETSLTGRIATARTIKYTSYKSDGTLETNTILSNSGSDKIDPYGFTLALPNVDNDSAVVKSTGHELLFTDPVIIAVLASPPYWSEINDTASGGSSSFGYITQTDEEEGSSHGFSVGSSIGTSFELPFGIAEATLKAEVENSFNWGTASTYSLKETWQYNTAVGEDKVIFTSVPFDVYYYEILSSSDSSQIGETISINVPRQPGTYSQTVTFFNSHVEDYSIDDTVLTHTPGQPFTYDDKDERDNKKSENNNIGIFSEHSLDVGEGSSSNTITIEELSGETTTYEYTNDVTVSAELEAGGITAGVSAGYQYGYNYSTSVSEGTFLSGTVPNIPAESYDTDHIFEWGIMSYPVTFEGQTFTLLTYWVE